MLKTLLAWFFKLLLCYKKGGIKLHNWSTSQIWNQNQKDLGDGSGIQIRFRMKTIQRLKISRYCPFVSCRSFIIPDLTYHSPGSLFNAFLSSHFYYVKVLHIVYTTLEISGETRKPVSAGKTKCVQWAGVVSVYRRAVTFEKKFEMGYGSGSFGFVKDFWEQI